MPREALALLLSLKTEYPQAAEFAAQYMLQPPSETVMLEAFTNASFR
jgi:hypothetical protein